MNKSAFIPALFMLGTSGSGASALPSQSWLADSKLMQQQVSTAIADFERTPRKHWSFTVSRFESEEGDVVTSEERFEPHTDSQKQWSLLKLNGEIPTPKQARAFAEQKAEEGSKEYRIALSELIVSDSLGFISEDEYSALAGFNVRLQRLGDKASQKLRGQLSFNKQELFIESIVITNHAPFSPVFSAEITEFEMTLSFKKIDQAILPYQQSLSMKGSFAFFTEIDETSTDTYRHYRYQPPLSTAIKATTD